MVDTTNLRILLALSSRPEMFLKTFDVKTAFLNGTLDQEIYMILPDGFAKTGQICLLKKALYGLKQATLGWHKRLTEFLRTKGIEQLKTDKCIYKKEQNSLHLAVHVDDGMIIGSDMKAVDKLLKVLQTEFKIKIDHNPKNYLDMEVKKSRNITTLSQSAYAEKVLKKYNMWDYHPAYILMEPRGKNVPRAEPKFPYREALGSLQYMACKTRPDMQ